MKVAFHGVGLCPSDIISVVLESLRVIFVTSYKMVVLNKKKVKEKKLNALLWM